MEEGERKTGVLAQQDLGHQGSVSRGRLMKTRNTEGLRWERRRCYRSKNKQQIIKRPQLSQSLQVGFSTFYSPRGAAGFGIFPRNSWEPWAWTPWRVTLTFGGNFEHQPFALCLHSAFSLELVLHTLHVLKELFLLELIPAQQGPGITLGRGHIPPWEPCRDGAAQAPARGLFPVLWAGIPSWKSHGRQQSQHQWPSTGT